MKCRIRVWNPEKKEMVNYTYGSLPYIYISLEGEAIINGVAKRNWPVMLGAELKKGRGFIFDGDIRKWKGPSVDGYMATFVVLFEDGTFRKQYEGWDNSIDRPPLYKYELDLTEHIGNIYKNPELVKN